MQYHSTRNKTISISSAEAIKKGLSAEGGLFVPETIPAVGYEEIKSLAEKSYQERAFFILSKFLTDFTAEELQGCIEKAYTTEKFGTANIAPVYKLNAQNYFLELWHGPTCAFKDMALQILPHLLTTSMKKTKEDCEVVILVATSGDTGKAALEGFRDVDGTRIVVFYPNHGVSEIQKLQMVTQEGKNVHVCAVEGNFDDAQTGVKRIFGDDAFAKELAEKGYVLSSANSINWGRLVPQVAYYFSAYADLLARGEIKMGDEVNFCVPTGNFGNILAAYYAKRMGLPVGRLVCASNSNNVLFDFIEQGVYNANRPFHKTTSPSMDILVSSNLERLLYELCGRKDGQVTQWMQALKNGGVYTVDDNTHSALTESFDAGWADDEKAAETIRTVRDAHGYTMDPHTAVAWTVAEEYAKRTGDNRPMVVVSTASPYKFSRSVLTAIAGEGAAEGLDEFACADKLETLSGMRMPASLRELRGKAQRHKDVVAPADMIDEVRAWTK